MGYYIETPFPKGKADWLIDNENAEEVSQNAPADRPDDLALICVVENPDFDAAAIVYNERERTDFLPTAYDQRPRRWLLMSRARVVELNPSVVKGFDE